MRPGDGGFCAWGSLQAFQRDMGQNTDENAGALSEMRFTCGPNSGFLEYKSEEYGLAMNISGYTVALEVNAQAQYKFQVPVSRDAHQLIPCSWKLSSKSPSLLRLIWHKVCCECHVVMLREGCRILGWVHQQVLCQGVGYSQKRGAGPT
jgi:hypothetical protein